jgi:adenosylcobinamide-phosphate synthase
LPRASGLRDAVRGWIAGCERNFDAGRAHHAWVVWCIAVIVPAVVVALLYHALARQGTLFALAFDVAALYVTLGFRQFSHYFTDIREALARGDEGEARRLLAQWQHIDTSELPRTELLRHLIEHALLAAHRHVFGVFFWFVALSALGLGPAGAVLYRLAEQGRRYWGQRARPRGGSNGPISPVPAGDSRDPWLDGAGVRGSEALPALALRLFALIDHVPARLTAFGFAVVGNFEDAVAGWRRDASLWPQPDEGIILAAAAGAVGVQLGGAMPAGAEAARRRDDAAPDAALRGTASTTGGLPAQAAHLDSVVGLVWRSVLLWLLLVAMLTLANVLG